MQKSILVVDDHPNIREIICGFLGNQPGLNVCGQAADGYDALEKAAELQPDLIILDMSMPRLNGIQTAARLKKMLPSTPIILLTSYYGALGGGYVTRAAGIDAVVAKDSHLSLLLKNVQSLLEAVAAA